MKVVVQRVLESKVEIEKKVKGKIENGMMILVGFKKTDKVEMLDYFVNKIIKLRIFDDEFGIMNKNIIESKGSILSISQFTLYGDAKKSNRPSYSDSMSGDEASVLYDLFNKKLSEFVKVETGIFGSEMKVSLVNDGPVTIIIEKENE